MLEKSCRKQSCPNANTFQPTANNPSQMQLSYRFTRLGSQWMWARKKPRNSFSHNFPLNEAMYSLSKSCHARQGGWKGSIQYSRWLGKPYGLVLPSPGFCLTLVVMIFTVVVFARVQLIHQIQLSKVLNSKKSTLSTPTMDRPLSKNPDYLLQPVAPANTENCSSFELKTSEKSLVSWNMHENELKNDRIKKITRFHGSTC